MPTKIISQTTSGEKTALKVLVYPRRFKTSLCRSFSKQGSCPYGEHCSFAHGVHELRPACGPPAKKAEAEDQVKQVSKALPQASQRKINESASVSPGMSAVIRCDPKLYKTELCRTFSTINFCPYGDKCQFAHGLDQLRALHSTRRNTRNGSVVGVHQRHRSVASMAPADSEVAMRQVQSAQLAQAPQPAQQGAAAARRRSAFVRDRRVYHAEMQPRKYRDGHTAGKAREYSGVSQGTPVPVSVPVQAVPMRRLPTTVSPARTSLVLPSRATVPLVLVDDSKAGADAHGSRKRSGCDPRLYKTGICRNFQQTCQCPYEAKCRFAHGVADLRVKPLNSTIGGSHVPSGDMERNQATAPRHLTVSAVIGPASSSTSFGGTLAGLRLRDIESSEEGISPLITHLRNSLQTTDRFDRPWVRLGCN